MQYNSYSAVEVNTKANNVVQFNTSQIDLDLVISYINAINLYLNTTESIQKSQLIYKNHKFELQIKDFNNSCDFREVYIIFPEQKIENIANCLYKHQYIDSLTYKRGTDEKDEYEEKIVSDITLR